MSEGSTDQLFLALRLAAVEQSISSGVPLPFLADDLFVNFDDARARAGFQVLAELARSTQVLFFTTTSTCCRSREASSALKCCRSAPWPAGGLRDGPSASRRDRGYILCRAQILLPSGSRR